MMNGDGPMVAGPGGGSPSRRASGRVRKPQLLCLRLPRKAGAWSQLWETQEPLVCKVGCQALQGEGTAQAKAGARMLPGGQSAANALRGHNGSAVRYLFPAVSTPR